MIASPYATQFTRTGVVDMNNRKPYRNKAQKAEAKATAFRTKNGTWRSTAPVSYHKEVDAKSKGQSV